MKSRRIRAVYQYVSVLLVCLLTCILAAAPVAAAEANPGSENPGAENPGAEQDPASPTTPVPADPSVVATNGTPGWPQMRDIFSDTAVLMDADTGAVLFDKSMDRQMYPASVTKLMTILLALENGNLEDQVAMTETGTAYVADGSSNLYTQVGEVFTLEQLLYGTMLKSANDMATQVGEYIGGTLDNFIQMMNDRAASLGCTGTHFENACGMPNEAHMTTAHDLALIAQQDLKYEKFREIVHTATYAIPPTNMTATERSMTNHNALLVTPEFFYPGIIGGKTGYTDAAQSCLSNFASREGMTLIVITLHAMDGSYAAQDNVDLLNYGFDNFRTVDVGIADYITSGGKIILPANADVKDCTVEKNESVDAEGNRMIDHVYYFGGRRVGNMLMTEANAKAYEEHLKAEAEKNRKKNSEKESVKENKTGNKNPGQDESSGPADSKNTMIKTDTGQKTSVTGNQESSSGNQPDDSLKEADHDQKIRSILFRIMIGILIFIVVFVIVMTAALNYVRNKKRRNRKKNRADRSRKG